VNKYTIYIYFLNSWYKHHERRYLLPAGGTISSSSFSWVRFHIRNITERSSSFASSIHPWKAHTRYGLGFGIALKESTDLDAAPFIQGHETIDW